MNDDATDKTGRALAGAPLARALFSPRRIALIGASADEDRLTSRPLRILERHGYPGMVTRFESSDARSATCDPPADTSGGLADHALIMTPATGVAAAIERCAGAGIPVATVLSAGFAELGARGKRRQADLLATASRAGIRLLGPNSLGIVNVQGRVVLSVNAVFEREPLQTGGVSVVSQSGSMLGAIVTRAQDRGIGFAKLVSVGNECDIATGELVDLLVDDADTKVILLFLEALRDAPRLALASRRAFAAGKPVVAYKVGRCRATRELALSHTGALTDDHALASAFFRQHGILQVETFEALYEIPNLVLGHRPARRRRLSAVTVSGGAAAMVVDGLRGCGVDLAPPSNEVLARLASRGVRCSPAPVIDLPMGRADQGAYAAALGALLDSADCDIVLAVQGSNAAYLPQSVHERVLAVGKPSKPLAVFLGPRADEAGRILQQHGIASFRTPEACADAIRAYCDWRIPAPAFAMAADHQASLEEAARQAPRGVLNEFESAALLRAAGICVAPAQVVRGPADEITIDFPVAAKVLSRQIAHKSDVGGVLLDVATRSELKAAIARLHAEFSSARPDIAPEGILVQTMQQGIVEVLLGYRHSAEVGPVVMVGLGGTLAELAAERAVRCAPVDLQTARAMIDEVPALRRLMNGYRNRPAADSTALAAAIHQLSMLALVEDPIVLDAEINPLIVKTDGAVAVDALVRISNHADDPE